MSVFSETRDSDLSNGLSLVESYTLWKSYWVAKVGGGGRFRMCLHFCKDFKGVFAFLIRREYFIRKLEILIYLMVSISWRVTRDGKAIGSPRLGMVVDFAFFLSFARIIKVFRNFNGRPMESHGKIGF